MTRRLVLTVPRRGDGQTVNQAVRESFRELAPWMPWAKRLPSAAETEAFCREAGRAFSQRKEFPFLIRLRATGAVIGGTGLVRADWTVPKSEVGYWLHTDWTGRGYATEAVDAVVRFARKYLRVRRLEIRTDPRNGRSAAVARRAGFKLESTARQDAHDNRGRLRNTRVFVRLF